jgi:hypothetical protein
MPNSAAEDSAMCGVWHEAAEIFLTAYHGYGTNAFFSSGALNVLPQNSHLQ